LKIVSFDSARVTWLVPLEEIAPAAGAHSVSIIGLLAARYNFSIVPSITTRDDMEKKGLPFGMGHFEVDGQRFLVSDFIVYNDGLVAVSEKTEWAEKFLEDVIQWVTKEFGFRTPSSGIRKLYGSTIVVDFDNSLSQLFADYEKIANLISSHTVMVMPERKTMQFSRMDFEVDKNALEGQLAIPKFILERRGGVKFSQERFYSAAPMHTADHVKVLTEIERLAARR
jgi:hypothetical protein